MPHISIVTLGVADVAEATAFYKRLGYVRSEKGSHPTISFFRAGSTVLALYGKDALREDAAAEGLWTGQGGMTLAQNMESEAAVDDFLAKAEAAGARILKPAAKAFWGGYSGMFADPDGHAWEVAHNPFFPLNDDGSVQLPD